jgi:hypothetical protein
MGRHPQTDFGRAPDTAGCIVFCDIKSQRSSSAMTHQPQFAPPAMASPACSCQEQFDQAFLSLMADSCVHKNSLAAEGPGNLLAQDLNETTATHGQVQGPTLRLHRDANAAFRMCLQEDSAGFGFLAKDQDGILG